MIDVFVSIPYNHKKQTFINHRVAIVGEYIAKLINDGVVAPYSPISAMHSVVQKWHINSEYDFWREHCREMIKMSKELHVLRVPGYLDSKGVAGEIADAKEFGVPITYIDTYYFRRIDRREDRRHG